MRKLKEKDDNKEKDSKKEDIDKKEDVDKKEDGSVIKNESNDIKNSRKDNDVIADASYELGRAARIVKNTCVEIFNDIME